MDSKKIDGTDLYVESSDRAETCDGCRASIPPGTLHVWGIESCCGGGCARRLCRVCILKAAKLPSLREGTREDEQ